MVNYKFEGLGQLCIALSFFTAMLLQKRNDMENEGIFAVSFLQYHQN